MKREIESEYCFHSVRLHGLNNNDRIIQHEQGEKNEFNVSAEYWFLIFIEGSLNPA